MAAIDSLLGIVDLQKADGIVLAPGKTPTLLGGKGGGALTMPPLDATVMTLLIEELLTPDERLRLDAGEVIERALDLGPGRRFSLTARTEAGRPRLVVRRGGARAARSPDIPAPAPVAPSEPVAAAVPAPPPPPIDVAAGLSDAVVRALEAGLEAGVSDVILSDGREPLGKRRGRVEALGGGRVTESDLLALLGACANPGARKRLDDTGSVDFALEHDGHARFRVNLFRQQDGLAAVLRPIRDEVPSLEALHLPPGLARTVAVPNGLVLMTGATGSGKSTTLAALVDHVARTRPCHVVTLEDPIEYRFRSTAAVVHQREIGAHAASFADGLRAALRESPDVLLLGEMRDPETIALALTAAETGHLVLSTLHAGTAMGAIERIVGSSPEAQRGAVRAQLASALRFVITQQLLPGVDGEPVPAVEVLAVNYAVAAQIRDGRTQLIATQIELGSDEGMVTMDQALLDLARAGRISRQTALAASLNREALERQLPPPRRP